MKNKFLSIILLLIFALPICGQVNTFKVKNKELPISHKIERSKISKSHLPKLDIQKLRKEDSLDIRNGLPPRFGYAFDVKLNLDNSGSWFTVDSGMVWNLEISTNNALSINLIFSDFYLSKGAVFYIYNTSESMIMGPLTFLQNNESQTFATDIISGDGVILHLFVPASDIDKSRIEVSKVIHGYKKLFTSQDPEHDSENCNNDVDCPEFSGWSDQSGAVALILLGDNNTRICSGCLLNNTNNDFRPFFLTAFHCIDMNQDGVLQANEITNSNNWVFRFKYESPSPVCNGGESLLDDQSFIWFNGSVFRSAWANTDFALLEMNNTPPRGERIYYAGWSRSTTALNSGACIHHPSTDVKKISIENNAATSVAWAGGASDHWRVNFDDGTCEPGSSGGPLFDQNRRVVGQVHGVQGFNPYLSFCDQRRIDFGRFDVSWNGGGANNNRLSNWLDPRGIIGTNGTFNGAYQPCPGTTLSNRTWNSSATYRNCQINVTNGSVINSSTVTFDAESEVIINGNFNVQSGSTLNLR